jgi:hypothetical protein
LVTNGVYIEKIEDAGLGDEEEDKSITIGPSTDVLNFNFGLNNAAEDVMMNFNRFREIYHSLHPMSK